MIFTYNKEHVGDVLMVIVKNSGDAKLDVERKGNVARVFLKVNGETVAWNIFEVSSLFEIAERGANRCRGSQCACWIENHCSSSWSDDA